MKTRVCLLLIVSSLTQLLEAIEYPEWAEVHFGAQKDTPAAAAEADFNGDGIANIIAFASGFDPNEDNQDLLPKAVWGEFSESAGGIYFQYFESQTAELVQLEIQSSSNGNDWATVTTAPSMIDNSILSGADLKQIPLATVQYAQFLRMVISLEEIVVVLVPNLVNLTLQEAFEALDELGLGVGEVDSVQTIQFLPGQVLFQGTSTGTSLEGGSKVNVIASLPLDPNRFIAVFADRVIESETTAEAYYRAVDPYDEKLTLSQWMRTNGVDAAYGAVDGIGQDGAVRAETVYFNNGDLGFGRHMYMHSGVDIYGNPSLIYWVTNHADVEDAWQKADRPLATVAMEFSSDPEGIREPFVKFYTFGPDGGRITKIDLDLRGEKFQPGMCTSCHGGRPRNLVGGIYPEKGDIGTRFLPFDLDTFSYSTLNPAYTKENQQADFKLLNQWIMFHHMEYSAVEQAAVETERESNSGSIFFNGQNSGQQSLDMVVSGLEGVLESIEFFIPDKGASSSYNFTAQPGGNFYLGLMSPSGTVLTLIDANQIGIGNSELKYNDFTLRDGAAESLIAFDVYAGIATGEFRPSNPLSIFKGETPNGIWTLTYEIELSGIDMDVDLNRWGLRFRTADPEPFNANGFTEAPSRTEVFYEGENLVLNASSVASTAEGTISVSGVVGTIEELRVRLPAFENSITFLPLPHHSFGSEKLQSIRLSLISPQGTTVVLLDPATSPATPQDQDSVFGEVVFMDGADRVLSDLSNPYVGEILPRNPLSAFIGEDPNGDWTIRMETLNPGEDFDSLLRRFSLMINPDRNLKQAPVELIQNWYGGDDLANANHLENTPPTGWREPEAPPGSEELYLKTLKHSCRVCHVNQQTNSVALRTQNEFIGLGNRIHHLAFENGSMPAAKRTFENYWQSFDPDQYRMLMDYLNRYTPPDIQPMRIAAIEDPEYSYPALRHLAVNGAGDGGLHMVVNDPNLNLLLISSADGGLTWSVKTSSELPFSNLVGIASSNEADESSGKLYALDVNNLVPRIWEATDLSGSSWILRSSSGMPSIVSSGDLRDRLLSSRYSENKLYLTHEGSPGNIATAGVYRSTNSGNSWVRIFDSPALSMTEDPLEADVVYAVSQPTGGTVEVWKIGPGQQSKIGTFSAETGQIAISSEGVQTSIFVLLGYDNQLLRTDDEGANWINLQGNLPSATSMNSLQYKKLVTLPNKPGHVYLSVFESYGLIGSPDYGETWSRFLNEDFNPKSGDNIVVPYDLTAHPSRPELYFIGWEYDSDGGFDLYRARVPDFEFKGPGTPIAEVFAPAQIKGGESVSLNGSRSLYSSNFNWTLLSAPEGTTAGVDYVFSGNTSSIASFSSTAAGNFKFQLQTSSGAVSSDPVKFVIRVENEVVVEKLNFKNDIMPLFVDCTTQCHNGQNDNIYGKLDLSSANDATVHRELTEEPSVRDGTPRVNLASPESSLILTQPSNITTNHGGGLRPGFEEGGPAYNALLRWIQEGAER